MPFINFCKKLLRSRLAQIFVVTHFIAIAAIFLFKPYQEGGGLAYKFFDEPLYYRILFYLDLPTFLLSGLIFSPLGNIKFYGLAFYIFSATFLIISSIQWLLAGYCLEKVVKFFTNKKLL
ncbi:MAG TPA: hypothetical protein PKY82_12660 [Pyrinomonadaceae bacterium]|nr:hypothetical protein [Pyrinomonadaceae bacterium]